MSKVARSTRRPLFRWIAAGSMAAFMVSSLYTTAFGQSASQIDPPAGCCTDLDPTCLAECTADPTDPFCQDLCVQDPTLPFCTPVDCTADPFAPGCPCDLDPNAAGCNNPPPVGDDDDDDSGLSDGEIAAIAVGALAVGAGVWYLMGRKKKSDGGEEQKVQSTKPESKISSLRLVPSTRRMGAGDRAVLDLQAKGASGKWQSVTDLEGASIEVKGDSAGLMKLDGSKNAFALPISASGEGKSVTLVGSYQGLSAQTSLQLAGN